MRVFEIFCEIEGVTPPVWRRMELAETLSLKGVHAALQAVMGWRGEYPACFSAAGTLWPIGDWPDPGRDAAGLTLGGLRDLAGDEFFYDYEPDDPWRVRCRFEAESRADAIRPPTCLAGGRAAPPDGVGGREGYADFLRMLGDPEADPDEVEDMLEWAGGAFDPDAFDLAAANRRLERIGVNRL
ncbi:MAG TPA: plasmid pRiA4b ORF-3 family protein [Candidatus Ozemobacteraceae bacterium]|nr:plasmid pRiA4b ORF-3 family protein [Candidatus Ozemobacteraceae bacterium]